MEVLMICLAVINSLQALVMCLGFIIGLTIAILPIILFFQVLTVYCLEITDTI